MAHAPGAGPREHSRHVREPAQQEHGVGGVQGFGQALRAVQVAAHDLDPGPSPGTGGGGVTDHPAHRPPLIGKKPDQFASDMP
jgi:hypothetical protein